MPGSSRLIPELVSEPLRPPEIAGAQKWETTEGDTLFGLRIGTHHWLWSPGVVTFRFGPSGPVSFDSDGRTMDQVRTFWERSALPLAVQARGTQVLHASALANESRLIAICGRSTAGKSTIAAAGEGGGVRAVADDAVAVAFNAAGVQAVTLPYELRLRPASARHLGRPAISGRQRGGETRLLRCVVLLEPDGEACGLSITPLGPSAALGALMPNAYCFSLEDSREKLVNDYGALTTSVRVVSVRYRQTLEFLDEIVLAVRGLLDAES